MIDAQPAGSLPDAADNVDRAEGFGDGHEVNAGTEKIVQWARYGKENSDHTAEDDNGNEVWKIQNKLNVLLESYAPYPV